MMKPQISDGYNLFMDARPAAKGCIAGIFRRERHHPDFGPDPQWIHIAEGESHRAGPDTAIQVQSSGNRIESFLFTSDADIRGPLHVAFYAADDVRHHFRGATITPRRAVLSAGVSVLVAITLILLPAWTDVPFWTSSAQVELSATLSMGWIFLASLGAYCLMSRPDCLPRTVRIAAPRTRL